VKSLMDAAQQQQFFENQQEKWRKLCFQMKIKLKPQDIAVRCRLFEGVISGGEIASFLMKKTSSSSSSSSATTSSSSAKDNQNNSNAPSLIQTVESTSYIETAKDRLEACKIGQELLSCGLLLVVCAGFIEEEDEDRHRNILFDDEDNNGTHSPNNANVTTNANAAVNQAINNAADQSAASASASAGGTFELEG
jgi:hypothetical protein